MMPSHCLHKTLLFIDIIAKGMEDILDIDPDIVYQKVQEKPNSAWQVIAEKVPDEVGDQVNAYVEENDLKAPLLTPEEELDLAA